MPHLVTSSQGVDHIESENVRHYNAGTLGNGSFALVGRGNFECTMPNSNTLRIASGDAQCCGAHWTIDPEYEEYTIENGTPGYKRIDLAVADIKIAPKEEIKILILKGEETTGAPVAPTHIEGDLNAGDTHVQMPICSVTLDGINPGEPQLLMDFLVPAKEAWDSLSQKVDSLKPLIKTRDAEAPSTYTIQAGGTYNAHYSVPNVPGYVAVGALGYNTGNFSVMLVTLACGNGAVDAVFKNWAGSSTTFRPSVRVLYVRNGWWQWTN